MSLSVRVCRNRKLMDGLGEVFGAMSNRFGAKIANRRSSQQLKVFRDACLTKTLAEVQSDHRNGEERGFR